ncbi:hypothetical protein MSAN_00258500 [Mycena sanguinolenta]|uniref:MYND-type domain-containing protein n=1 Tax=Mycena sanguinolenta TaxID=230812 RepID=A0A8H7DLB4_9AGAR|nr:hypothetical protein MSAN_00258500 [Mycena sanguinolenta]
MRSPRDESPARPVSPTTASRNARIKAAAYRWALDEASRTPTQKVLGIPSKQNSPEDWNLHFGKALAEKYGPGADLCNIHISGESKILLAQEGVLVGLAIEQLTYNDFEAKWAALDVKEKKRIVLDGIVRAAYIAREKSRPDCPEMSVLGLLKAIHAHDPNPTFRIRSIYLFRHPAVEQEYYPFTTESARDDYRAFGHLRMIERSFFIVQALMGILEAYAGVPAPKTSIKEEAEGETMQNCYACGAVPSERSTITLKKCSGCKAVWYCSRACQHRDWRVHKKLCGSLSTKFDSGLVTATSNDLAPAEFVGCPAAAPGYVRSPALWRQIWRLSKKDSYDRDYHFDTTPGNTRSIRIPDRMGLGVIFLVARRRAMRSGDRGAVCKMYSILEYHRVNDVFQLTAHQIRSQLEREYRVTLDSPADFGAPPTAEEISEELEYMRRRTRPGDKQEEADERWSMAAGDLVNIWERWDADPDSYP